MSKWTDPGDWQPVRQFLEMHAGIDSVAINVGGPTEFDPAQGEVMKPTGVEFAVAEDDNSVLQHISDACDRWDLQVIVPPHKQPQYEARGEVYNEGVDYDVFVRLVPDK